MLPVHCAHEQSVARKDEALQDEALQDEASQDGSSCPACEASQDGSSCPEDPDTRCNHKDYVTLKEILARVKQTKPPDITAVQDCANILIWVRTRDFPEVRNT
jgi:hypothetical protein